MNTRHFTRALFSNIFPGFTIYCAIAASIVLFGFSEAKSRASDTLRVIVNNDDGAPFYKEHRGEWHSSAGTFIFPQGWPNPTSRYVIRPSYPDARCEFIPDIPCAASYALYYGGPMCFSASTHALVEVHSSGGAIDSVWFNQNTPHGSEWRYLGTYHFSQGMENSVFLVNDGTGSGYVLRADLFKFETPGPVELIIDDTDSLLYHDGPEDTTWYTAAGGIHDAHRVTDKYQHPEAWARWNINVPFTNQYNLSITNPSLGMKDSLTSRVYCYTITSHARTDTIVITYTLSDTMRLWSYIGTYQFTVGEAHCVTLRNTPEVAAVDPSPLLRADAVKVTQVVTSVDSDLHELPSHPPLTFTLRQNYPNPFNAHTTISYSLPARCTVILKIFNMYGREITALINETQSAGTHFLLWDAGTLPTGVYLLRMEVGNSVQVRKLLLLQ